MNEITKRIIIIAFSLLIVVGFVTSCSVEDNRNFYKTRQICIENGGSVITRWGPSGISTVNCELSGKPVEAD